ncbi:hypothetical protein GWO43_28760 [candidate division KSB1 bacterium]|nr:hypothetical protein [candidate division KSB1 bacterium]NIR71087.1 hypothetical protein [candidate division KSB1 bacterium]NIS27897.1 hypothetical protein [candidate division KSB1 bacterium]NIT74780.1 hypothetical protein [candidate division KSB1 bacterium]NIU28557.1 hypothetical protein [candidate division KSB1 bacterium]
MKYRVMVVSILVLGLFALYASNDVQAYPWFARRLVDNCNKCHVSFPKTNDYGEYVKYTGYELPQMDYTGLEESPLKHFLRYVPVAMRFKMDAINSEPSNAEGDLNFREIQLISGGSILDNKISWWFHKHVVEDNTAVNLFDGTPHEMWAQYNLQFGKSDVNRVGVRYGMAELPLKFSPSKTKVSEVGYAIYNAILGNNTFTLSTPQYGVAVNGLRLGGDGFNEVQSTLSLAVVNGTGDFSSYDFNQIFGRVGTEVANTMIGAFTYVGSQEVPLTMETDEHAEEDEHVADEHTDEHADEHVDEPLTADNNVFRLGFDFDMDITPMFNVYGLGLYGRDGNPLGLQLADSGNFYGGFFGMDYCPSERLMFSWRFDAVRFSGLPAAEHDEHAEEEHAEHEEEAPVDEHEAEVVDDHGTGNVHIHGDLISTDTDAMIFGFQYLLPIPNYQLRLTTEYRIGIRGQSDLIISGLQFAL